MWGVWEEGYSGTFFSLSARAPWEGEWEGEWQVYGGCWTIGGILTAELGSGLDLFDSRLITSRYLLLSSYGRGIVWVLNIPLC